MTDDWRRPCASTPSNRRSGPARSRPRRGASPSTSCSRAAPSSTSGAASCAPPTSASSVRSSRACTNAGSRTDALEAIDCTGRFVAPGFVDMHVHFESSMLTPGGYAEAVCPRGTTTVFVDPHELANVAGVAGVRYAVEASRGLPVRFIVQAPSCVPPQPGLELSGADLYGPRHRRDAVVGRGRRPGRGDGHDRRARRRRSHGRRGRRRTRERQARVGPRGRAHRRGAAGLSRGGHDLRPRDLHRARLPREAARRVDRRAARHDRPDPARHRRRGEQSAVARRRISSPPPTTSSRSRCSTTAASTISCAGSSRTAWIPLLALRCATYNAAYRLQRADLGLVAAGPPRRHRGAHRSHESFTAEHVLTDGRLVASGGRMLVDVVEGPSDPPFDTMRLAHLDAADMLLRLDVPDGRHRMRVIADAVMTRWDETDVDVRDGVVEIPPRRHRAGHGAPPRPDRAGAAVGPPVGLGRTGPGPSPRRSRTTRTTSWCSGAIRTTWRSPPTRSSRRAAGSRWRAAGEVLAHVALPIAGILSPLPAAEVAAAQRVVQDAAVEHRARSRRRSPSRCSR